MTPETLNFHSHDTESPIVALSPEVYILYEPREGQSITVGIHPWDSEDDQLGAFDIIANSFSDPHVVAVGEIGIDPTRVTDVERQYYLTEVQVRHAANAGLPVVFHIVRRFDLLLELKRRYRPTQPWAVHGFRGKPEVAKMLFDQGIYISLGLRFNVASARIIPDNLLLVETDELPEARIADVVAAVAEARGTTPKAIADLCRKNLHRFFGK